MTNITLNWSLKLAKFAPTFGAPLVLFIGDLIFHLDWQKGYWFRERRNVPQALH